MASVNFHRMGAINDFVSTAVWNIDVRFMEISFDSSRLQMLASAADGAGI